MNPQNKFILIRIGFYTSIISIFVVGLIVINKIVN